MPSQQQSNQSFRDRVIGASVWSLGGHFSSQLIRLASNLIMTRLLVPEMFGIMAIANSIVIGVTLFSDMGLRQNIIQHKKGGTPEFLNTAWSLSIIRGIFIFFIIQLLALGLYFLQLTQVFSDDSVYGSSYLPLILSFLALSAIFSGFQSTNLAKANRDLYLVRIVSLDLTSQVIGMLVMIAWASFDKTIWALVAGTLVTPFLKMVFSHWLMPGHQNRWYWDHALFIEMFHFGKWIFLATIFTFLGGKGMRLIQGALVSVDDLAFIAIAGIFAWSLGEAVSRLSSSVVFPVFSEMARKSNYELTKAISTFQSKMLLLVIPAFILLSFISENLITILYDDRYHQVGAYLKIMSLNGAIAILTIYYQNAFLAIGDSKQNFKYSVIASLLRFSGVFIGFSYYGIEGMLYGIGIGTFLFYLLVARRTYNKGWLVLKADNLAILVIFLSYTIIIF